MLELLVQVYIEDRQSQIDECLRAAEAKRWARLASAQSTGSFSRLPGFRQRTRRASSAAFAAGHSASINE